VQKTISQYNIIIDSARTIFHNKMLDYGSTWRVLRPSSLLDQIFIKAKRIRSIQNAGEQKIDESLDGEFFAIFNYSIMVLIQLQLDFTEEPDLNVKEALELYDNEVDKVRSLMIAKNHDYGEAWRDMQVSSIADIILVKLFRIRQILDNSGKTITSEGIESNFHDIANYSIFSLILLNENK
jgi:hypothetical protein